MKFHMILFAISSFVIAMFASSFVFDIINGTFGSHSTIESVIFVSSCAVAVFCAMHADTEEGL